MTTFFQTLVQQSFHPLLTQNIHVRICLHLHHLSPSRPICQNWISSCVPAQRNGGGAKERAERQRESKEEMAVISFRIFLLLHVDFYQRINTVEVAGRSMRWKSPVITDEVYRLSLSKPTPEFDSRCLTGQPTDPWT